MKKTLAVVASLAFAAGATADIWNINDTLSGIEEVPPNASPGTGSIIGTYDDTSNSLTFNLLFSGLIGPTTAAHFHIAPPGVAGPVTIGFVGFPAGVMSGGYANTYVLTGAQETSLLGGNMYVNVHSQVFPGGEIRAQLHPTPAPGAGALFALGGLAFLRRRR
ncbi:hypothetical protein PHYC_03032 [Phycisphaerales bacterium]|nr:hypothetical protein PHYC_03032 [Phycisphaerales bacterium]